MDSILKKISEKQEKPEDAAAMDASIRESKRSCTARELVNAVNAAHDRGVPPHEIQVELAEMGEEYPKLFSMVLDPGYSRVMLNAMLSQLEAVEVGKKSTHDASVVVGTLLANQFVRPKLGMAPVPLQDSAKQSAHRKGERKPGSK
jgi:hypothetical protein